MKSLFRDHKFVIPGLFALFILIPVIADVTANGEFDPYAFADAMARRIIWFGLLMTALYFLDLVNLRVQIGRGFVKQIAGTLRRKEGKRAAILDLRDARKLLASAEAAVLADDPEYAVMVADHVRGDRRDLFRKHPILRYEYARTMLVLELLRNSLDEAKRHLAALIRSQKELSAIRSHLRDPEQQFFQACIRLLEDPGEEAVRKLRDVPREGLTPIRQALGLCLLIRHYTQIGDARNRSLYKQSINGYFGDAVFLKEAGSEDIWVSHANVYARKPDPIMAFRFTAALVAAVIGILTAVEVIRDLRHGATNVVGWTAAALFAIGLGIFGSVRPVKTFARIGLLFGAAFLAFVTVNLFNFYPVSKQILSDPIERAEELSGVDFMLDGAIESIGQSHEYELLQILLVRIDYGDPTRAEVGNEIIMSGLFFTQGAFLSTHGAQIPACIETELEYTGFRYMLLNMTEGTINEPAAVFGPDVMILLG